MERNGKVILIGGLAIATIGALLWAGFGKGWLGRLPGDIQVSKGNFHFYFPIVTCIIASLVLTFIMWLLRK
jgi:hypothetical protein